MSQKIVLNMQNSGVLDTDSNPVLMNGQGARELLNCGDLDGDGIIKSLPATSASVARQSLRTTRRRR